MIAKTTVLGINRALRDDSHVTRNHRVERVKFFLLSGGQLHLGRLRRLRTREKVNECQGTNLRIHSVVDYTGARLDVHGICIVSSALDLLTT